MMLMIILKEFEWKCGGLWAKKGECVEKLFESRSKRNTLTEIRLCETRRLR